MPAATGLLERATALLEPEEEARLRLLPHLGHALMEAGELNRAEAVLAEAGEAASAPEIADSKPPSSLTRWAS